MHSMTATRICINDSDYHLLDDLALLWGVERSVALETILVIGANHALLKSGLEPQFQIHPQVLESPSRLHGLLALTGW